ncbi:MAG: hypothetical protein KDD60_07375, partial [Bdellovibrionales bacterium]|nr:hypothetical protein [Bdellovibrionales bacterium]
EIPLAVDQSLEGAETVAKIVKSMKQFSHPGSENMSAMELNAALDSTLTISRNEWKYVADVETDFVSPDPVLMCYGSELNQAFLNIIVNAAHAIRERVERGDFEKGKISLKTEIRGSEVIILISDNGTGIPEEILSKIYDPFFTTKDVGKGTGQGLTMVHQCITERHHGKILVHSTVDVGSTFEIHLPL